MSPEDTLESRLVALITEAQALPVRLLPTLDLRSAEALLSSLQDDLRRFDTPMPRVTERPSGPRSRPSLPMMADDMLLVEPSDSEPPRLLMPPRGAENREVLNTGRGRSSRPPPRFDPIAEAVSSAALHAEARRHESPPPLPRESEFDIVLSEDDLIEVDVEEPPRRLRTVAELLEED